MRSHVQHHRGVASYVFAGSEPSLLEQLFADVQRPFFGQAEMLRLGRPSAEALASAIEDGFARTERAAGPVLAPLLDLSQRHPQRTMLLAHCLWLATQPGEVTGEGEWLTAVDAARRRTLREHETRWESLTEPAASTARARHLRLALPARRRGGP